MPDVAILGAGPAGLAAAWFAARRGLDVVVHERSDRVGGLAGSFEVAGVRVDHGSHRLHAATPPHVLAELRALLGDDLQLRPRNGRLRLGDRWVGFPLKASRLPRELPPAFALRAVGESLLPRRPREDTYAEVLRAGLGPTMCERFYFPYARKLWGLDPEEISGEQARRRVRAGSPLGIARAVFKRPGGFLYPRRGFGQIAEALASAAADAGAEIRLRDEVTSVPEAGRVLSTLPLTVLARIAGGPETPLRFRAMRLAYVVHEGGRWTPYDAHYLPGPETPVTRLSEPANYRSSADDPSDRTVLCAEIPCSVGDEVWNAGDGELASLVTDAARAYGLPGLRVAHVESRALPYVYPIYARGFEPHFEALDRWATALPGVTTLGRNGLFAHDNTHHALVMAWDAVASLDDPAGWAEARRRFESHVVED